MTSMTAMLRIFALVVGLLLVGAGWLHFIHDPQVRRAQAAALGVDSLKARADSLTRAETLRQAAYADSLRRIRTADSVRAAALLARSREALGRADSLERAIQAVPDSLIPRAQALVALAAKDSALDVAERRRQQDSLAAAHAIGLLAAQIRADSAELGALHGELGEALRRLDVEVKSRRGRIHLCAAAGYGMAVSAGVARAGPAALGGVCVSL